MTAGNELNARISAYVDGERLDQQERRSVEEALRHSSATRGDVALQSATRNLLRSRAERLHVAVPNELAKGIAAQLDMMDSKSASTQQQHSVWSVGQALRSLFASPRYVQGLVAVGSVAVLALAALALFRSSGTSDRSELSSLAYAQYGQLINGALPLQVQTADHIQLRAYFASHGVEFEPFFPQMHASLRGGSVVTISGRQCVQLVYSAGNKSIYLLETDNDDIVDGSVSLDKGISDDVALSRWHWEERDNVGTMFVWKSNNVMCTAVSNMPTREFSALFQLETL